MKKHKRKELDEYSKIFPKWDKFIQNYLQIEYSTDEDISDEDYQKVHLNMAELLNSILSFYTSSCKVRDTFTEPLLDILPFGLSVVVGSEKMGIKLWLGIYESYFFLNTFVDYPWYIKSMDDKFWHELSKLSLLGEFHFLENSVPNSPESKSIFKKVKCKKSHIFNIILNYALLESSGGSNDFGSIEIRWPINNPWNDLLNKGSQAFNILYKVNYQLYRAYYLSTRNKGS
jgi:hypothetical protein